MTTWVDHIIGNAIERLAALGMPVNMLRYVAHNYSIWYTRGDDHVSPFFNRMLFDLSTLEDLRTFRPGLPFGETTSIQTFYHEATHAYIDIRCDRDHRTVVDLVSHGEQHYRAAPLEGAGTASDPNRIFQEAIASYVGHRAATWYGALENLTTYADTMSSHSRRAMPDRWYGNVAQIVRRIPGDYDRAMAQRTFGYQEIGALWWSRQAETTRRISDRMKTFADATLLEGMTPQTFTAARPLKDRYDRLLREIAHQRSVIPVEIVPSSVGTSR